MVKRRRTPDEAPPSDEQEWLSRLSRCVPAVSAWRERAKNPEFADAGSSLKADDVPGLLSVETTAWYSMCVSSEHLDFTLDAIRSTKTMYPTAYMPAVRTAFMTASNALFLLGGSSRLERRERALRMRADELRIQINGLREMVLPEEESKAPRDEFIHQLRERQQTLQKAAESIGHAEDVTKMRHNQTDVVNWVARYMRSRSDSPMITSAIQSIWRDGSSAAHGQLQYAIMRVLQNETVARSGDSSVVHMRGNLAQDVGAAFIGALLILNECFRLYDLRRVAP